MKGSRASGGVLGADPRAGYYPHRLPPPGDANPAHLLPLEQLTWSIRADEATMVTAALVGGIPAATTSSSSTASGSSSSSSRNSGRSRARRQPTSSTSSLDSDGEGGVEEAAEEAQRRQAAGLTWGLLMVEADRQGNLNVERCNALRLAPGGCGGWEGGGRG